MYDDLINELKKEAHKAATTIEALRAENVRLQEANIILAERVRRFQDKIGRVYDALESRPVSDTSIGENE